MASIRPSRTAPAGVSATPPSLSPTSWPACCWSSSSGRCRFSRAGHITGAEAMPPLHPRHRRPGRAPARGAGRSVAQSACRQTVAAASRTPPGDRRGVGAVLGQIGQAHPEVLLSGIDFKAQQIASARNHLTGPGLKAVELLVGDPAQRPERRGRKGVGAEAVRLADQGGGVDLVVRDDQHTRAPRLGR